MGNGKTKAQAIFLHPFTVCSGKRQFPFVCCKRKYICANIYALISNGNGKRKSRRLSLIPLPFAHRANESLSFVRLLTKKQTEVIHLQTD